MRLRVFRCVSLLVPFCARSFKRQLTHPNCVTLTDVALMLGVSTDVGDSILDMGERSYYGAVGMPVGSPRLLIFLWQPSDTLLSEALVRIRFLACLVPPRKRSRGR